MNILIFLLFFHLFVNSDVCIPKSEKMRRVALLCLLTLTLWHRPLYAQRAETGMATVKVGTPLGSTTAYGEQHDDSDFTGSSETFSYNDLVRVTRLDDEEQSLVIRINDRLPGNRDAVIHLSAAAAERLGLHKGEAVMVRVTLIEEGAGHIVRQRLKDLVWSDSNPPTPMEIDAQHKSIGSPFANNQFGVLPPATNPEPEQEVESQKAFENTQDSNLRFGAQLGAFSSLENAKAHIEILRMQHGITGLLTQEKETVDGQRLYLVISGWFSTRTRAESESGKLRELGIEAIPVALPEK